MFNLIANNLQTQCKPLEQDEMMKFREDLLLWGSILFFLFVLCPLSAFAESKEQSNDKIPFVSYERAPILMHVSDSNQHSAQSFEILSVTPTTSFFSLDAISKFIGSAVEKTAKKICETSNNFNEVKFSLGVDANGELAVVGMGINSGIEITYICQIKHDSKGKR